MQVAAVACDGRRIFLLGMEEVEVPLFGLHGIGEDLLLSSLSFPRFSCTPLPPSCVSLTCRILLKSVLVAIPTPNSPQKQTIALLVTTAR